MSENTKADKDVYDEALGKVGSPYEHAYGVYGVQIAEAEAAYRRMADEARVNRALASLAGRKSDSAAGITKKAGRRTTDQRRENNLRNELGSIERQHADYSKNVKHALDKLSVQEAAEEESYSARKRAEESANRLSQSRVDAEFGLQQEQLNLYKSDSDFNKAYRLYLKRYFDPKRFKNMTGIKIKKLPVLRRRVQKPLIIQLKPTDASIKSSDPDYELKTSINPDSSTTKYLVSKKLIEDADKVGVKIIDGAGRLRDEKKLMRDVYGVGVKPSVVPAGTKESDVYAKDPGYISLAFSDSDGRASLCYVKKDVYEFAKGRGIDLDINGKPKNNMQLMRDLFGIDSKGDVDYAQLDENLKNGSDKIIDMFGREDYSVMSSYAACREAGAPSSCIEAVNDAMSALDLMIMHPGIYQGEDKQDYYIKLSEQFDIVKYELAKVEPVWHTITQSGNMDRYNNMLHMFVQGVVGNLPEEEASTLPDIETLNNKVKAALAGEIYDPQAQMVIDRLPKTVVDILTYDTASADNVLRTEELLRKENDIMPTGLYEKLEAADMPMWFVMPEQRNDESKIIALSTYIQHDYWTKMLGEGYDKEGEWSKRFPTDEEVNEVFKAKGLELAEKNDASISGEQAIEIGWRFNYIENINPAKRGDAQIQAGNKYGSLQILLENGFLMDTTTGFISDRPITVTDLDNYSSLPSSEELNDKISKQMMKVCLGGEYEEEELVYLERYGFGKVADLIRSKKQGDYFELTDKTKQDFEKEIIAQADKEYYIAQLKDNQQAMDKEYMADENYNEIINEVKNNSEINGEKKTAFDAAAWNLTRLQQISSVVISNMLDDYDAGKINEERRIYCIEPLKQAFTEDMRNTIRYLYGVAVKTGDFSELDKYWDAVGPLIREATYQSSLLADKYDVNQPGPWGEILSGLKSIAGTITAPVAWIETVYDAITGQRVDTTSPAQLGARWSTDYAKLAVSTIEDPFLKKIAETVIYLAPRLPLFFIPGVGQIAGPAFIGLSSAGIDAAQQNLMGVSAQDAAWHSTITGAIDFFSSALMVKGFGKIMKGATIPASLGEKILNYGVRAFKFGMVGGTGAAGNVFTKNLTDMLIAKDKSRFAQLANQYISEGMTESEATTAAAVELLFTQPAEMFLEAGAKSAMLSIFSSATGEIKASNAASGASVENEVMANFNKYTASNSPMALPGNAPALTADSVAAAVKAVQALPPAALPAAEYNGVMNAYYAYGLSPTEKNAQTVINLAEQSFGKVISEDKEEVNTENPDIDSDDAMGDNERHNTRDLIDNIKIIDGKVGGKIPVDEFKALRKSSIKNPDADTMTLGKYTPTIVNGIEDWSKPGPDSYIARARNDSSFFDMGNDYIKIQKQYSLIDEEMFNYFNRPALDDAINRNKTIRFSHDPRRIKGFLGMEWAYIKSKLSITDYDLLKIGEFWYVK